MDHPRNNYWFTNPARMAIAISSGMAIFFLGLRHYYKKQWLNEFFIDDDPNNQKEPDLFKQYNEDILEGADKKNYVEK